MLDQLTIETFEPHVGTSFWAEFPAGGKVELRLERVAKVMESVAAQLPRHPFSLFFIGPGSHMLEQSIYHLTHEALEAMDIFIVPVSKTADSYKYEAVFT
jgi:hypothetical protein